jgi:hypothetical protein
VEKKKEEKKKKRAARIGVGEWGNGGMAQLEKKNRTGDIDIAASQKHKAGSGGSVRPGVPWALG